MQRSFKRQQQQQQPQQQQVQYKKVNNDFTEEQKQELRECFDLFSETGIEPHELRQAFIALGYTQQNEEIQRIFKMIDRNGNKPITYDNYLNIMKDPVLYPEEEMKRIFWKFCDVNKEKITKQSLKQIFNELGENVTEEELQEMIYEADFDDDNEVSYTDFCSIMRKAGIF